MNNRIKRLTAVAVIAALLSACAGHTWAPGPQVAGDFGRVSGQCKLLAMGSGRGHFTYAYGRPQFVAAVLGASLLANAIGSAVRQQSAYNACMESAGFVAVE